MYGRCNIPHNADFLFTTRTLSFYHRCSLFFFSCFSTTDAPFLCCTLFLMLQKPSSRTADATLLLLNTLSIGNTSVAFLIMKTFSSDHTPCRPAAAVTHLILYTLSSYCTAFSLYCRCDPPGTAHFLYSNCRCDILDTAGFLLTPHTISYYRCSPSDTVHSLITLHKLFLILQIRPSWYCTLSPLVLQM